MTILKGEGITKKFGGLVAVDNVEFKIRQGEIVGLIGPNGSGKTTLLNIISGIYKDAKGKVWFNKKMILGRKPYQIGRIGIAKTFQIVKPLSNETVRENVLIGALFGTGYSQKLDKQTFEFVDEILDFIGLLYQKDNYAANLNIISLKKLELARALAMRPKVLLLDEVMAGLNLSEIKEAIELILKIKERGLTTIIVEHVMKAIMSVSDKIFVLHHGKKIAEGTPKEIINNDLVIKAYLGKRYAKFKKGEN